eukprot:CAMPEP_0181084202 /NCGR_PEP_ID=MMETSP1071-20121207/4571_1 /TAXON_ID=35127 /ORGANISM="Thalassiosira sp., Strain NH16" /LENGTH=652 /DNA_ID=CAMNT_0023165923 /DNA_START=161 /DNA_END=2119 /DNA_ORIENTATION=+
MSNTGTGFVRTFSQTKYNCVILACAGVGTAVVVGAISSRQPSQAEKKQKGDGNHLEMYLMDKIAKKPYLNYHSASSSAAYHQQAKRYHRGRQKDGNSEKTSDFHDNTRPKGVPSRLRLLTIDVPEFKQDAFGEHGGICKLPSEIFDTNKPSYVDGVAPSKPMNKTFGHNERVGTRASRKSIVQKSLAKQLYYCYDPQYKHRVTNQQPTDRTPEEGKQRPLPRSSEKQTEQVEEQPVVVGVEIIEASIMGLNPNNIRRTYTTASRSWKRKSYSYDPGKYADRDDAENDESGVADADEAEREEETLRQKATSVDERQSFESSDEEDDDDGSKEKDIDSSDYERSAPWNQYAWLEEIYLRINGMVPFGEPMQRAHFLSRWIHGRIYRQSVPVSPSRGGWLTWLWWPVLWSGSHAIGKENHLASRDGVDGKGENILYGSDAGNRGTISHAHFPLVSSSKAALNRASNKPHAVICDGAAMQRVPGSLRYLSKICREAGIPLYILNDPRSWGSQTHSTLSDAIADMRKTISDSVIRHALDLREGSAFERGRLVGQLEKEMAWQAYDAARKTRDALVDARRRLRRDELEDWSDLSDEDLTRKLIERKVILQYEDEENVEEVGVKSDGQLQQFMKCSDSFLRICQKFETDFNKKCATRMT